MSAAFCFSNKNQLLEYYHNSSWLEHGGSPDRAVKLAFVNQIDAFLKAKNLYKKGESKITFTDVQDCLIFVSSSFSTQTSYENQTKKSHHQQVHSAGHDGVPQAQPGSVLHRKARRGDEAGPAGAGEQAEPRACGQGAPGCEKRRSPPR